jgi:hypothetical protein
MDRRKEFELGPASARELYTHGDQHVGKPWHDSVRPGIGRKIGLGVYKREDIKNLQQEESGRQELPLGTGAWRKRAEPHEQTEAQFEKDPRTWFHGEYTWHDEEQLRRQSEAAAGLHIGTLQAAHDRLKTTGPGYRDEDTHMPARIFAGRIHGPVAQKLSDDQGDRWNRSQSTRLYENDTEHRGSISAIVPHEVGDATSFPGFRTHQEAVHEHLMAQEDPQAALEALHPRVRAEYLAKGGTAGRHPNIGRQFSSHETYDHPETVPPPAHEQLAMVKQVTVSRKTYEFTPDDYDELDRKLGGLHAGGPPQMPPKLKVGKKSKAF